MTAPSRIASAIEATFSEEDDRRIVDGYLRDRKPMLEAFVAAGISRQAVAKRAELLGLSATFIARCTADNMEPSVRRCLACDQQFASQGPHNRLCRRCRKRG